MNVLEAAFADLGAHAETNTVVEVHALEGDEERGGLNGMLQTGSLEDGRRVLALAALDRGSVVYLVTAVFPSREEERAKRFVLSFHLIYDGDKSEAVHLDLPADQQMRTRREEAARRAAHKR